METIEIKSVKIGRPQKYTPEESVEVARERARIYHHANAEKIKEMKKVYYEQHKDEFRERYKKRYYGNKVKPEEKQ